LARAEAARAIAPALAPHGASASARSFRIRRPQRVTVQFETGDPIDDRGFAGGVGSFAGSRVATNWVACRYHSRMASAPTTRLDAQLDLPCVGSDSRPVRWSTTRGGRGSFLVWGAVLLALVACPAGKAIDRRAVQGGPLDASHAAVSPRSTDAQSAEVVPSAGSMADGGPAADITAPCVLHAGDSRRHRREVLKPKGKGGSVVESDRCSFNAECIWIQGVASPGDGNVELDCVARRCTCRRTLLSASMTASTIAFQSEVPCGTADQAERLLIERCMTGLKIVGQ